MHPTKIVREPIEVDATLMDVFGVNRTDLFPVVHKVIAARNESVLNDPVMAKGIFAYIFGTRAIRDLFRPKGWIIDRTDNIEAVLHPEGENQTCLSEHR